MAAPSLAQRLAAELRKFPGLDPKAVFAVAAQEGLGGGIGDQGTSFGPFQLHKGGALPATVPLSEAHGWAWSPQGIDYALSRIASVAGGLRGAPAVQNIVQRFERPANPSREIAGALHAYGLPAPTGGAPASSSAYGSAASPIPAAQAGYTPGQQFALQLLANNPAFNRGGGLGLAQMLASMGGGS